MRECTISTEPFVCPANRCILRKGPLEGIEEGERIDSLTTPTTFGELLKFLRKRAQLTQRELAISVGYSEAHISRLETNQRLPDLATLAALFVPALRLENDPASAARLMEMAVEARANSRSSEEELTIEHIVQHEVTETVKSVEAPGNLPLELTSFLGRERELDELRTLLKENGHVRLLTLVGVGGSGKTRLALHAAEQSLNDYPDGAWFVDLAPLGDPAQVGHLTASILEIRIIPDQDITKALVAFLRERKALILLDNCEHLLDAAGALIEVLLRTCPNVRIVATSRQALNIPGEKRFEVLPLLSPDEGETRLDVIAGFDSVRLFVERARNIRRSFELTAENAPHVSRICRRLDGIPLALELAAARVGLLRARQIESALRDRFALLTGGSRTLPRHQTMRGMIDWSYELLSEDEQCLFRRLAVFVGGWTLDAAHAVVSDSVQTPTIELLSRLVDKSLISAVRHPGAEARYSIFETLREYALGKLEAANEGDVVREHHFRYLHTFARAARLYGPEKHVWLDLLENEYDNIRAAVVWGLADSAHGLTHPEEVAELILPILDFFWFRGFTAEARAWMDKLIARGMPASPLHALLLQKAGWFARGSGDFRKADSVLRTALAMARDIGDTKRASWALVDLGLSARDQGNAERAVSYFSEALTLARESGDKRAIGVALYSLAESSHLAGSLAASISLWQEGLTIFREEGDQTHIAWGLEGLAGTAYSAREFASAFRFHLESLKIKVGVMDKLGIAHSFEGLAQVAADDEEPERAAVLWGAANRLRQEIGAPPDPSRAALYTSLIPRTRNQLGKDAFGQAWSRGGTMKLDGAIAFALRDALV